jgi:hypothetical protein
VKEEDGVYATVPRLRVISSAEHRRALEQAFPSLGVEAGGQPISRLSRCGTDESDGESATTLHITLPTYGTANCLISTKIETAILLPRLSTYASVSLARQPVLQPGRFPPSML